ncbi:hypothetical protein BDZ89DRAFT_1076803 [Hymenopellis radicata]|nr:hypothetical protein BDZ89DRAFT_1076803 [Hymenopellis radicata]
MGGLDVARTSDYLFEWYSMLVRLGDTRFRHSKSKVGTLDCMDQSKRWIDGPLVRALVPRRPS